jgi:prepilin-type processing-associated H-X9-DG protein
MSENARVDLKERFTRIEFVVVIFVLAISLLIFGTAIPRAWSLKQRLSCQENLKTIGQALRMYANESKGEFYPPPKTRDCAGAVQPWSGAMDMAVVYPDYLAELDLLVCPAYPAGKSALRIWDEGETTNSRWKPMEGFSNNGTIEPCEMLAKPYYYYGWALSEATFESAPRPASPAPQVTVQAGEKAAAPTTVVAFDEPVHMDRFRTAVASMASDPVPETWVLTNAEGKSLELPIGSTIPRLREGVARMYIHEIGNPVAAQEAQGRIVVMHEELFEKPEDFFHGAGRANILYMDGHVACRQFQPGVAAPFPLNEAGTILRDAVEGVLIVPTPAEVASE